MVLVQTLLWTQTLPQPLPSSSWVSFETWTSDRFTVNISMLWTWEVMKKLYWIRKVEAFSHWSQAVYCDLDRWSYFYSVCTCFVHSIRPSSKKIEQLSRKRSVPQWHNHIISSVDISSQAAGEMLPKRRHSIKPLSYIEKSVLLNMVEWWKLEANVVSCMWNLPKESCLLILRGCSNRTRFCLKVWVAGQWNKKKKTWSRDMHFKSWTSLNLSTILLELHMREVLQKTQEGAVHTEYVYEFHCAAFQLFSV